MRRALLLLTLFACDPGPAKLDDVRVEIDSSDPGGLVRFERESFPPRDILGGKVLPNGIHVAEGFGAVLRIQPSWKKFSTLEELPGGLRFTIAQPDIASIEPVPNETRRFFIVGKKVGTTTVQVTTDGAQGSQSFPFEVVPQKTN